MFLIQGFTNVIKEIEKQKNVTLIVTSFGSDLWSKVCLSVLFPKIHTLLSSLHAFNCIVVSSSNSGVAPSVVDASWIQCYSEEFLTFTDLLVFRFVADNQIGSTAATKVVAKARKATMRTERKSFIVCVLHLVAESK